MINGSPQATKPPIKARLVSSSAPSPAAGQSAPAPPAQSVEGQDARTGRGLAGILMFLVSAAAGGAAAAWLCR